MVLNWQYGKMQLVISLQHFLLLIENMKVDNINLLFELKNGFPILTTEPREYGILGMFLSVWNSSREVKDELLPYIDERIKKGKDQIIDSQGKIHIKAFEADPLADAVIDKEFTVVTNWDDSSDKCELKTQDFKKITLKWLEFLESQGR